MKRVAVVVMSTLLLLPGVASAGSSTDAALGLGAFAVFNQIISGTGVFGRSGTVIVERPVVVAPPPVVYAPPPPPPVVYVPPPAVIYEPAPVYGYYSSYGYYDQPRHAWCPPGLAKKGRCHEHWSRHR